MPLGYEQAVAAADFLRNYLPARPTILVILGSGLGGFATTLEAPQALTYESIPHFPCSTVAGHRGEWLSGYCQGIPVAVMAGRFHYYEGYEPDQITFPIRVASLLGIERLVITNAAGGVNLSFARGDLMLIEDQINLIGINPLRGMHDDRWGERFADLVNAYDAGYRRMALAAATAVGISLQQGVYAALPGPSYETPAEVNMLRVIGADAVGMSTVLEVIVARQMKMQVLGISCITNSAAGVSGEALQHQEVLQTAAAASDRLTQLLAVLIPQLSSFEGAPVIPVDREKR